jgi:hypothetical protein
VRDDVDDQGNPIYETTKKGEIVTDADGNPITVAANARAVYRFSPSPPAKVDPKTGDDVRDKNGDPVPDRSQADWVKTCAQEAVALVAASSPGDSVEPEVEQPLKTQTISI